MSDSILNTPVEAKFRLLLLFSILPEGRYTQKWLSAMDFLAIYGASFQCDGKNLHGDSWMKFTEYALRIWNVRDALHDLVMHKWLTAVPTSTGYLYQISPDGKTMAQEFSTTYALPYRKNAAECFAKYGHYTGAELDAMIRSASMSETRREDSLD